MVQQLFGITNFELKYVDEEKDLITVSTNDELMEYQNQVAQSGDKLLRFFVYDLKAPVKDYDSKMDPEMTMEPEKKGKIRELLTSVVRMAITNPFSFQGYMQEFYDIIAKKDSKEEVDSLTNLLAGLGIEKEEQVISQLESEDHPILDQFFDFFKEKLELENSTPSHSKVVCDGCSSIINGIRHKCKVCPNFDLCSDCIRIRNVHDYGHTFIKSHYMSSNDPYHRNHYANTIDDGSFSASLVSHETIPDGEKVEAETPYVKIWKLRNDGDSRWLEGTRLVYVGGDDIASVKGVKVHPAESGKEIDVAVDIVTPMTPGRYISYWKLTTPGGAQFGERIWVDILVV
eukprot:TRINITY_DN1529_c0_g1_i1.p1 TRINITY_DN1529_c0_g1~~TRINITY_DN1529_c0_g1_i1.p1  ORF type:complete len:386 (-),score=85.96 TRINITY_DN1529_c0_g1_i1:46-1077(-)